MRSPRMSQRPDIEPEDPEVAALARDVLGYLEQHPDAADTTEHIARWWILRQRIEAALAKTQKALDYLESQGAVVRSAQGVYRLADPHR